ncbi:hypothetical protein [Streptomyces sp. BV286]|uniref:hypothetical protein n=1 Tax=unclassified Streptomyces TaxID=2593676 RepID=UPI001C2EC992|nr:hypothetical protein [Streptomyces sp. BV286]MBV1935941.1 hypothetical protein [Streptomyces sp. BV286]
MSRRIQHNRTASPAEGEQHCSHRPQRFVHVTALAGSGLSSAALSWSLLSHSPVWAAVVAGSVGVVAVTGIIAPHTPHLVRALIWRLTLRTVLREVRQFAREDLLTEKITPKDLMKLAAKVHRSTLENHPTQSRDNHGNDS